MFDEYKVWLTKQGNVDGTIKTYILSIEQYMQWYSGTFGTDMTMMLHENIMDYRSYLKNVRRLKSLTVNNKLSALISYDGFLIETGRQKESAVSKKDLLRTQAVYTSPGDLVEKDVDSFRQRILLEKGKRDHALITILAYAGLRISETLALSPEDVDLVGRQITVQKGKGNKERVVYIGDKIIHAVRNYLKELAQGEQWLFPGRGNEHLDRSVINKLCNEFSDKITPHRLRHFYCSHALEKGYSVHEVANQAGHSNIHTTLRYSNPNSDAMREKANKL